MQSISLTTIRLPDSVKVLNLAYSPHHYYCHNPTASCLLQNVSHQNTKNLILLNGKLDLDIMAKLRPVFEEVVFPGPASSEVGFRFEDVEHFSLVIEQLGEYR